MVRRLALKYNIKFYVIYIIYLLQSYVVEIQIMFNILTRCVVSAYTV
jgi:hypothetical protein